MKYSEQAAELIDLLDRDQEEWKESAKTELSKELAADDLQSLNKILREKVTIRGKRALDILDEIGGAPSLDNIGPEAAIALSILATHYSLGATKQVLAAFEACYLQSPANTQLTSIPAMTDLIEVAERRPQKFGTIWLFDENNYPFLPAVVDFQNTNKRRAVYSIGTLRWPKSLAIPESAQPWLHRPISAVNMRPPTEEELKAFCDRMLA